MKEWHSYKQLLFPSGLLCIFLFLFCTCTGNHGSTKPNVLLILADDLGYGDLGCYNDSSWIPTPNLDRLAGQGVMLTNAYCPVSVCSPSRYALMTGEYPWRSWRKSGVMRNYERSMIEDHLITLPEMLKEAGYKTAGFGKWHLGATFPTLDGKQPAGHGTFRADNNGANLDLTKPVVDGPLDHGFDHWIGFSCASETWILEDDRIFGAVGHDLYTIEATPKKERIEVIPLADYLPYITAKSISYLESHVSGGSDEPVFLYFAPYVPHIPLAVNEQFIGKTRAGLYGDYVHELDYFIGKLLSTLDRLDLSNNTLVLFASDNGSQFLLTSPELDRSVATNSPADIVSGSALSGHRPNDQLRGTKWSIYEGGVRTPFIARWPGQIPQASAKDDIFALNDVLATLAHVVDSDLVDEGEDSINQMSMLSGSGNGPRNEVMVQSSGLVFGLRSEKWKYILDVKTGEVELHNLKEDPFEAYNLSEAVPEVAHRLDLKLRNMIGDHITISGRE